MQKAINFLNKGSLTYYPDTVYKILFFTTISTILMYVMYPFIKFFIKKEFFEYEFQSKYVLRLGAFYIQAFIYAIFVLMFQGKV